MLILSRRIGEAIVISDNIRILVLSASGGTVRLDRLDGSWWRDHYSGARRLLN